MAEQGLTLIEEHDCVLQMRFTEEASEVHLHRLLRAEHLGRVDHEEPLTQLLRHRFCSEGLAGTRRTDERHDDAPAMRDAGAQAGGGEEVAVFGMVGDERVDRRPQPLG